MSFLWCLTILVPLFLWFIIKGNKDYKEKLERLVASRPPLTKNEYVGYFVKEGYEKERVEAIYEEIISYINYDWFLLYPEDDFYKDYEIDPEDLEDCLAKIYKRLGLNFPNEQKVSAFYKQRSENINTLYFLDLMNL